MAVEIKILKAYKGDCIWLRYGEYTYTNILIDSGPAKFKSGFQKIIDKVKKKGESIDLLIFTHIDNDHIGGAKKYFENTNHDFEIIKEIWINTASEVCKHFNIEYKGDKEIAMDAINQSYAPQIANKLIEFITSKKIKVKQLIMANEKVIPFSGAELIILSPTEKELRSMVERWGEFNINTPFASKAYNEIDIDNLNKINKFDKDLNPYNGSSIAFIFKYGDISLLLLGDSYSDTVSTNLRRYNNGQLLDIDLVKLSHHGSSSNTNYDLLNQIKCFNYAISTSGSNSHPSKFTIARIINCNKDNTNKIMLYCNYNWWRNKNYFTSNDKEKYLGSTIELCELSNKMLEIKKGLLIANE